MNIFWKIGYAWVEYKWSNIKSGLQPVSYLKLLSYGEYYVEPPVHSCHGKNTLTCIFCAYFSTNK